jgi:hypothetical protein
VELGCFFWLLYSCFWCNIAPVGSNNWLRCTRDAVRADAEHDKWGDSYAGETTGHWRCGLCNEKWTWRQGGHRRLFVLGEASTSKGFAPGYRFGFAGALSAKTDNLIMFLKSVTALRFLDGKAVTKEALLQCIEKANNEVHKKFSAGMREVKAVTSRIDRKKLADANCHATCEDPRLSLRSSGKVFLAIDFSTIQVEEWSEAEVVALLKIVAAGLNIEEHEPEGPAQWYLKQEILDSPGFKRPRVLMQQICG